jgi:hypothetical protein
VGGNPISFTDPSGLFAPLVVIIPAVSGLVSGIFAELDEAKKCDSTVGSIAGAFGRGFASGFSGSLAGMGAFAATGNPFLAGAAGGAVGSAVNSAIAGQANLSDAVISTGVGAVAGPLASRVLPTRGRLPNLITPRGVTNFGPNSARLVGQEGIGSGIGGAAGAAAAWSGGGDECGCRR